MSNAIAASENPFGGIIPEPKALTSDPQQFAAELDRSLKVWREAGYRVVWLEVPIGKSALILEAVVRGFAFHHSRHDYLMLTLPLVEGAFIPAYASHYIGAGGVAINDRQELLVVRERYHGNSKRPPRFKLPGGALHEGEHLEEAVVREVLEETGVHTRFDALVCFRHWHGYRFGKSDIYFVCRLRPLNEEITIQEEEIVESRWMPVQEYLHAEEVSDFNKKIVRTAVESEGIVSTHIDGYGDPMQFEFFMPNGADRRK
ncbi:MAG: NUDIX domain-containing protein [Candidatus Latescibacterota bacterium]|nr:NUDIX domain-containing protein [Candidatus Latescibacterota bacterium]